MPKANWRTSSRYVPPPRYIEVSPNKFVDEETKFGVRVGWTLFRASGNGWQCTLSVFHTRKHKSFFVQGPWKKTWPSAVKACEQEVNQFLDQLPGSGNRF